MLSFFGSCLYLNSLACPSLATALCGESSARLETFPWGTHTGVARQSICIARGRVEDTRVGSRAAAGWLRGWCRTTSLSRPSHRCSFSNLWAEALSSALPLRVAVWLLLRVGQPSGEFLVREHLARGSHCSIASAVLLGELQCLVPAGRTGGCG